ncbi:MAG: hypothetical protein KC464_22810, partial [Myxococcales bacterium]|nr:hypothetical protein [Myxococcales bacterium]
ASRARDQAATGGDDARRELDRLRRRVAEREEAKSQAGPAPEVNVLTAELEALKRKVTEATEKAGAAERSMKSLEAELELARTEARQAKAEAERAKAAPAAEAPPGDDATVVAKVPGELRDMAQQVYESINDILSELRNNILLVQGELGNAGGGNEESLRIITDAVDSVVGNAEDAKGALRGLRELAES